MTPKSQARVHEAHPELAFARLNDGKALVSKHSAAGLTVRKRLLVRAGFVLLNKWLQDLRGSGAKADDLLDACALVLTARHIVLGEARVHPAGIERDARGLRMAMVC